MATAKPKRMMFGGVAKRDPGTGTMPRPGMGPRPPSMMGPRAPIGGVKPTGVGQAMNRPRMGPVAAQKLAGAGAAAGRALGMGKKKGGAVKKAIKK